MIRLYCSSKSTSLKRSFCGAHSPYQTWRGLLTLAIETSCDDTAVAVLQGCRRNSTKNNGLVPNSQKGGIGKAQLLYDKRITAPNTGLGGIHPLKALDSHQANLAILVAEATNHLPDIKAPENDLDPEEPTYRMLERADGSMKRLPDFISVTRGPGMQSNLNCGIDTAKGLAAAWDIPLVGVHHMQAHALSLRMVKALYPQEPAGPEYPFLSLLVSGGHTMLLLSSSLTDHEILATTGDIAIGDALDKCGRFILPQQLREEMKDTAYAREMSTYAFPKSLNNSFEDWPVPRRREEEVLKPDNTYGWQVRAPLADTKEIRFSFTGLRSGLEKIFRSREATMTDEERRLFAQTALGIAFEHIGSRIIIALEILRKTRGLEIETIVASGGVASNDFMYNVLGRMLKSRGFENIKIERPMAKWCTDNAAMIAWCGMEMFAAGYRSELGIGAQREWSMDPNIAGGILGASGWVKM